MKYLNTTTVALLVILFLALLIKFNPTARRSFYSVVAKVPILNKYVVDDSYANLIPLPDVTEYTSPDRVDETGYVQSDVDKAIAANNDFAIKMYSTLKKTSKNLFFSPYSMSTAFAMVYEGARNNTAEEISNVFGFNKDLQKNRSSYAYLFNKYNPEKADYRLSVANAIWVQNDYKILNEYTNVLDQFYGAKAENVDFRGNLEPSRLKINTWVEKQTMDKIKDLFPKGSLNESTKLALTNAVYFKGSWVKAFDPKDTVEERFIHGEITDNVVNVPMMRRTDKDALFPYYEDENAQLLEMPYQGDDLSMMVILPKQKVALDKIETNLTSKMLAAWQSKMVVKEVNVFFPKFKLETDYDLIKPLKNLGMQEPFALTSDFSGMDGTKKLYIGTVVHKAFVDVNEEGTEAAAATGIGMMTKTSANIDPVPVFRADHPFIFIIKDKVSGNILFIGRFVIP